MQERISRTSQNHTSAPQTNPFQPKPFDIDSPKKSATPTSDIDLNAAPEQGQHYGHDLTNIPIFPPKSTENIPENESYEQQIQRQIGLSSLKPLNVPTFQELQERPNGKQLNYQKDPVVIPHWAVNSSNPVSPVQAKLTIGQPGDKYEQEADQVASQVVQRINAPVVEQSNQGQSVQRQEVPEEEEPVQAKLEMTSLQRQEVSQEEEEPVQAKSILQRREAVGGGEASIDLDTAINSKRGSGQSLDAGLQRSMGQAMGADFSGVKIHTDAQSDQLNQSIQARAFTTGQDVFFRQGAYQPGSRDGQELIAHELTHVVQQNGGVVQRSPQNSIQPMIQRDKAEQTESVAGTIWATDSQGKILPPSLDDISQGGVNDCFLFAAMAAIVNTNPQQIVSMIQDHGNGTYTVTFKGIGLFSSAKQTVSANFAVGKHGNVMSRKALWPLIIEKAYIQQKGGMDALENGGNPGSAVDDMLNDGPSRFDPRDKSADYIMAKLALAKKNKWPMTILAPKKEGASKDKKEMADNTPGLHFWHAYTILDIDPVKNRIKLFNPWGNDHPNGDGWIDVEQVRKFFIEVNIND